MFPTVGFLLVMSRTRVVCFSVLLRACRFGNTPPWSVSYRDVGSEEYSFPSGAKGIVPILHGPGLRTQATVRLQ